jgi:alpha-1,6-mannosyltransferase
MNIVQAANFVTPTSGGVRTTLRALAGGYRAAGHDVTQIVPGPVDSDQHAGIARVITVRAPLVPATGGYRVIPAGRRLERLLDELRPDRIEVSDRFTLQALARWGRRRGIPTVAIAHERLDALLSLYLPGCRLARGAADAWNRRFVAMFDTVVCTTRWARQEYDRIGAANIVQVPLGVDLSTFHPRRRSAALRRTLSPDGAPLLVLVSRLSPEKRPVLAIEALRTLRRRGMHARLVIAGDGPARAACERAAQGLPVLFTGFIAHRERLAELLASADVALAPGPIETFGLAALESLASGTPVVGRRAGALPELLTAGAGAVAYGHPASFAEETARILATDERLRRSGARGHAERFRWSVTVERMMAVHQLAVRQAA